MLKDCSPSKPRAPRTMWMKETVDSSATTRSEQMQKMYGYVKGLHATNLIQIGTKLGLFERLTDAGSGLTPEELAEELGLHAEYVRIWCETACTLELLDYCPKNGFRPAPFIDELFGRPDHPFSMRRVPDAHLLAARDYTLYPEIMRTGGTHLYGDHDEAFLRVAGGTKLARMFMDSVLPELPDLRDLLETRVSVLDVGCGVGNALFEFAERFPRVLCVGIDIEPTSVGWAQEEISTRGLADRVRAIQVDGAVWPEEFTNAFDLVTMILVLHEVSPDLKGAVLKQCWRALRPGGRFILIDEPYPGSPSELRDPERAFAVLAQWYEMGWGNVMDTREEISFMLDEQGLKITYETFVSRFYVAVADKCS